MREVGMRCLEMRGKYWCRRVCSSGGEDAASLGLGQGNGGLVLGLAFSCGLGGEEVGMLSRVLMVSLLSMLYLYLSLSSMSNGVCLELLGTSWFGCESGRTEEMKDGCY